VKVSRFLTVMQSSPIERKQTHNGPFGHEKPDCAR
jgi:hypothetical protein